MALGEQSADLGRADPLSTKDDLWDFVGNEAKFISHLPEHLNIPAAAFAEGESLA